jgi:hypothetical protein
MISVDSLRSSTACRLLNKNVMSRVVPLVACLLGLPLAACVVGDYSPFDDGKGGEHGPIDEPDNDMDPETPNDTTRISTNTTWTGTVAVEMTTTIDPGITVTVAPGTMIQLKPGAGLKVSGILDVQGTSAGKVIIASSDPTMAHGGISVLETGELKYNYAVQSGGGIYTKLGAKATIRDSSLSNPGGPSSRGDFLVMYGGTLDMQYSEIGLASGDGTHCQLHFGGAGNTITIMNSTIRGAPFGLMLYGGNAANLTNNNWENLQTDIDTQPGVSADITGSYFVKGAPTATGGAQLTGTVATVPVVDALPRP